MLPLYYSLSYLIWTCPHPRRLCWEQSSSQLYTEWTQILYLQIRKRSSDLGALGVTHVPNMLLPEACPWERHGLWASLSLQKSRWIARKVSRTCCQSHLPLWHRLPIYTHCVKSSSFLGCPPVRPLQPHLPEPRRTAFYFCVRVMKLSRDIRKQMGWFPDQQGVYDVIKIIDLEKSQRWVN